MPVVRIAARSRSGFTLIELLVAVAIIGILAAIAYPSYQDHVRTGRRTDAQRLMLEQVNQLEREYARNGRYPSAENYTLPSHAHYTLSYRSSTANFVLSATPGHSDPQCGTLTINQLGEKSALSTTCWKS